ncbi:membrane-anchored adenylyl cyclase [Mycobacterium marinum M]|uniref:Membrane-anchored adenylyl cyclase n=1 Tax=Mycobacterium marinum (strain ATCC BAA-535 / M) TaxID=216594 RepID=B2HLC7_MYCMM|nr:adenylate/guanylate cyclase domain-containing protein [Mycobacterium marinum]ACC43659.1 membrane-anchored adenylyl cyclase [Mycobacterium marinum M]
MTPVTVCRACGVEPLENARFCHECGAPIGAADTRAEYKQVTVLFADVAHSMDIAAAVGPERLREIMAELVTRASVVVQRYAGRVDKFTGDGVMALFGAPAALEDHALRACLAALDIQDEVARLAADISRTDGVELRLRIGLNSGEVITGGIGPTALGYTAVGEQVGMAQRMESIAPVGGVMVSDTTARLVDGVVLLGAPQRVQVKGMGTVSARELRSATAQHQRTDSAESTLVGRGWEVAAVSTMLDRAIHGRGSVVGVTGPVGIGKSRLVREAIGLARSRGVTVVHTYCESHAADVPFRVMTRLLRAVGQASGLDDEAARARVRDRVPDAQLPDLLLLDDLLGIAAPGAELPRIDPDARRRRLTGLINASQLARTEPVVFVLEDVHWIDEASESMLADFLTVMLQTPSLVLFTYRPEYRGALQLVPGAQTIALAPLTDADVSTLVAELLGQDPSVATIGRVISERAAGNPLFAEEMTRELAERGVLTGERGSYQCRTDVAEIRVPATVQAAIGARIDRLSPAAKQTLSAAAVVGSRFSSDLLIGLGIEPCIDELLDADLIDQVRFTTRAEYAFRHPLVRTVAYEAQLRADRAQLHRRLAQALENAEADPGDHHAALIAEHFEAAGDLAAAYRWHMRAGKWALNRDIAAARLSWERATRISDALPADTPDRSVKRIAPRTMLCGYAWRVHVNISDAHFAELRELCLAAADKTSLAIATAGLVMDRIYQARIHEGSRLASEAMGLIESIGNPTLTVGLSLTAIVAKAEQAQWLDVLHWSQLVIELADGDPTKGNFMIGSPLALALTTRAIARYCLGRPGWRDDVHQAVQTAGATDPVAYATVVAFVHNPGIAFGVLSPDEAAIREIEQAVQIAQQAGDDLALSSAQISLGIALLERGTEPGRGRGYGYLADTGDTLMRRGYSLGDLPIVEAYLARERGRRGDRDDALPMLRTAVDTLYRQGQLLSWGLPATHALVETLLDRGTEADWSEAQAAIERVADEPPDGPQPLRDIWLLRMRAALAGARGAGGDYQRLRESYRDMARTLDFGGHLAWADAMR